MRLGDVARVSDSEQDTRNAGLANGNDGPFRDESAHQTPPGASAPVPLEPTDADILWRYDLRGAPTGHAVNIREVRLSAGAEFVVMVCGDVMTMPGLPKVPSAEVIRLNDKGQVEGLF